MEINSIHTVKLDYRIWAEIILCMVPRRSVWSEGLPQSKDRRGSDIAYQGEMRWQFLGLVTNNERRCCAMA